MKRNSSGSIAGEAEKLRDEIRRHEHLYYVLDAPEIMDSEYELVAADSRTQRVVGKLPEEFFTPHSSAMLRLDNALNEGELREFER